MPLKLNVGASKKVTDNNYGSRGASINLEVKIDSALLAEPVKLQERIRQLYGLIRVSLAEELNGHAAAPPRPETSAVARPTRNGAAPRPATEAQVKAIVAIALKRRLDLGSLLQERFQIEKPESLTLKQASELIGSLKSAED